MRKQPTKPKARLVFAAFINAMRQAGYSAQAVEEMLAAGPLAESALVGTGVRCELRLPLQHSEDTDEGYFRPQGFKPASQEALDEFLRSGGTVKKLPVADKLFIERAAEAKKLAKREERRKAKTIVLADLDLEL